MLNVNSPLASYTIPLEDARVKSVYKTWFRGRNHLKQGTQETFPQSRTTNRYSRDRPRPSWRGQVNSSEVGPHGLCVLSAIACRCQYGPSRSYQFPLCTPYLTQFRPFCGARDSPLRKNTGQMCAVLA
jgi:hypothetical protein